MLYWCVTGLKWCVLLTCCNIRVTFVWKLPDLINLFLCGYYTWCKNVMCNYSVCKITSAPSENNTPTTHAFQSTVYAFIFALCSYLAYISWLADYPWSFILTCDTEWRALMGCCFTGMVIITAKPTVSAGLPGMDTSLDNSLESCKNTVL